LVREVQAILAEVGFYGGKVDGIFGDATKNAILDYQKQAGIIPDGEASYSLLANIKSAFAVAQVQTRIDGPSHTKINLQPELIVLDTATVEKVQSGLRDIYGEDQVSVDGIIGNQTRNAIRQFQKRFKLEVTGEIDQQTMEKLREAGIVGST
jgi:peptidoglycan hydrolase-like protein with peptidoglycan-binding domain